MAGRWSSTGGSIEEAAKLIGKNEGEDDGSVYTEIVIAPGYDEPALDVLRSKQKKKIRMIQTGKERPDYRYDMKELEGAVLLQEPADYRKRLDARRLEFPTTPSPTRRRSRSSSLHGRS